MRGIAWRAPVLALADAHRALVAVAQRDGLVIGVERDRDGAARAVRPLRRTQAASGPRAPDDAAPGGLRPLPGLAFGVRGHVVHFVFPSNADAAMLRAVAA